MLYTPCMVCGKPAWLEKHHILGRKKGLLNDARFIAYLCHDCHMQEDRLENKILIFKNMMAIWGVSWLQDVKKAIIDKGLHKPKELMIIQNLEKTKKIRMTFMAEVDYDSTIDDETLQEEYEGNILKAMQYLYEEEGIFWDGELKLISAELIEKNEVKE